MQRWIGEKRVDDGAGVIALEPAIGGDGAPACAVGASVHHDHAVTGAQQKFRLTNDTHAVVGNAVEEEDPVAIGVFRADFPAAEKRSIRRTYVKILASRPSDGEGNVGFADQIRREFAANGMEESRPGKPPGNSRQ